MAHFFYRRAVCLSSRPHAKRVASWPTNEVTNQSTTNQVDNTQLTNGHPVISFWGSAHHRPTDDLHLQTDGQVTDKTKRWAQPKWASDTESFDLAADKLIDEKNESTRRKNGART